MIKSNGGIIGPDNVTTGGAFGSASGVFKLGEVTNLIKESKWPTAGPQGYQSANSVRFNSASSDYLNRTPSSASNRKTFTFSFWVKRTKLGDSQTIYNVRPGGDGANRLSFHVSDTFRIAIEPPSKFVYTTRVFRDVSAWYHIVVAFDTTQGTASNRIKLYVNGVQETSLVKGDGSAASYPDQNSDLDINTTNVINIGRDLETSSDFIGMYLSEFVFIDGQQLAPTSFGETNSQTGIWVPKSVTGLTFGTNGFYQNYSNSGALGEDFSGNDNDFSVNNLTSLDQSTDTCSTNFATLNPARPLPTGFSLSEGNLKFSTASASNTGNVNSTILVNQGKWYAECKIGGGAEKEGIGAIGENELPANHFGSGTQNILFNADIPAVFINGSETSVSGVTPANNDILGMALDLDNGRAYFSVNGTYINSGNPSSGSGYYSFTVGSFFWGIGSADGSSLTGSAEMNYGSPSFAISSGNTDQNGFGNFEYAPPAGYLSLNTKNLAAVLG